MCLLVHVRVIIKILAGNYFAKGSRELLTFKSATGAALVAAVIHTFT